MHAIKKAARREAWYQHEDDNVQTYNPFGRLGSGNHPRKIRDVEHGTGNGRSDTLTTVRTETDAVSPIEQDRRSGYAENLSGYQHPPKSKTFGDTSDNTAHLTPYGGTSSEDSGEHANKNVDFVKEEQDGTIDQSVGPADTSNKPRKRKLRKFMPWKKDENQNGSDLDHKDTEDSKKTAKNPDITVWSQIRTVFLSWINILLVAVPVGFALEYSGVNKVVVFVVNFIAIIPLAAMLSYATEELAMYIGEVLGGLLNATFGNAVELIVSIIALQQGKIIIVQTSLIGSMLSNLLLVMGMCFFFGGLRRVEQFFNVTVAQTAASLLALAIGSLVIPTAFKIFANNDSGVAPTSQGTAVLLLVTYGCYLFFQLRTHVEMYNEPSAKAPKKPSSRRKSEGEAQKGLIGAAAGSAAAAGGGQKEQYQPQEDGDQAEEVPQLSKIGALVTLAGSTVLIAFCAEFMVSAIGEVAKSVSPEFIGLILLPIVGNAAEHATAVTVAIKDKMDLAIGVAIGSSLQIALLVLPLMVTINWIGLGGDTPPMTLAFDGFQVVVLFIAIIVVNYLIQDGKSHWLEGVLLQITYLIIAVAAWFYPVNVDLSG